MTKQTEMEMPDGGEIKKPDTSREINPYDMFDQWDEKQIVAQHAGLEVGTYLYEYPMGGSTVRGVSIAGMLALAQMWGGLEVDTVATDQVILNGRKFCRCKASGHDKFTVITMHATYSQPYERWSNKTNSYVPAIGKGNDHMIPIICESKAQRNVLRKVISPVAVARLLKIAEEGRVTFTEDDVKRVFGAIYTQRQAQKKIAFEYSMAAIAANSNVQISTPQAAIAPPATTGEIVEGDVVENSQPTGGGGFPGTDKQRKAVYALLKKLVKDGIFEDAWISPFVHETLTEYEAVSALIGDLKKGKTDRVDTWIANHIKEEK